MRLTVINGPNLNLLGTRSPEIYGDWTLADVENACRLWAAAVNAKADTFQSNHEGVIIDRLHAASTDADGVVINPGALTHYSYAIRDAIEAIAIPTVEVHLSDIMSREPFRRRSVIADVCAASIYGRGVDGYRDAIWHLAARNRWPVHTVAYGPEPRQIADLRVPEGDGPHPVAVLIHGGWWRDSGGRDVLDPLAVDLTERGWATWNTSYRGAAADGGSATALADITASLNGIADLGPDHGLDLDRVVTVGQGAGGQLAIAAATTRDAVRVRPVAAVGIAPVTDLAAARDAGLGRGAVEEYLGGDPKGAAARHRTSSPSELLPIGVPLLVIHGDADREVPAEMSRAFSGAAADAGDLVVYHELEAAGHDDPVHPGTTAYERVVDEMELLSERIAAAE